MKLNTWLEGRRSLAFAPNGCDHGCHAAQRRASQYRTGCYVYPHYWTSDMPQQQQGVASPDDIARRQVTFEPGKLVENQPFIPSVLALLTSSTVLQCAPSISRNTSDRLTIDVLVDASPATISAPCYDVQAYTRSAHYSHPTINLVHQRTSTTRDNVFSPLLRSFRRGFDVGIVVVLAVLQKFGNNLHSMFNASCGISICLMRAKDHKSVWHSWCQQT